MATAAESVPEGKDKTKEETKGEAAGEALSRGEAALARLLLAWYDRNGRALPWRTRPGEAPDPYRIWLSEIMLQQTTVATVGPYYQAFLERFPDLPSLAAASLDEVLHAWQGLGYYSRARHLHACAREVMQSHGGRFPETEKALRALPGIGDYTAAALAALAFGQRAVVMDGNVERVVARLFAVTEPLPGAKRRLKILTDALTPPNRTGDFAQAMMDLGATVCTPRQPQCLLCPWARACDGRQQGRAETLPAKTPKPEKPIRRGMVFWLAAPDGTVLLRRRPPKGLLGGLMELPSTPWREGKPWSIGEAVAHSPLVAPTWQPLSGLVRHTFTHFQLELSLLLGHGIGDETATTAVQAEAGIWVLPDALGDHALPTVMKKVIRLGLAAIATDPVSTAHSEGIASVRERDICAKAKH